MRFFRVKRINWVKCFTVSALVMFACLILLLVVSDFIYMAHWGIGPRRAWEILSTEEVVNAFHLSVFTSVVTLFWVMITAIPVGYALSRYRFPGHSFVNTFVDVPIVLPPIVLGISLLAFFGTPVGVHVKAFLDVMAGKSHYMVLSFLSMFKGVVVIGRVYRFWASIDSGVDGAMGIVMCQYLVSIAYCIRSVKSAFERVPRNYEEVALTLGCSDPSVFRSITIPLAMNGIIAGGVMAWARAIGVFGPLMVFVGTSKRVRVLPTHMWLHLNIGNIESALVVSMVTMIIAGLAITFVHYFSQDRNSQ